MGNIVLSLLVDNTSGVLSRVSGLFSRRGYNIDSVTVGETENPAYSRMTVAVSGDEASLIQIKKQLNKLEDVVDIVELEPGKSVCRELVLVKVKANPSERKDIISVADIFRANIKNGTELGKKAKAFMDKGELVPDELTCDLVMDRIKQDDCENGFVLDGFPRTIPQAEALTAALEKINEKMDYAIDVDVPDENIVNRMSGRRACLNCGATYHIVSIPTKVEGICDRCGQPVVLRDDDKPETVQKRLTVYHEQTQPLIDYYKKQSILKTVDGTQPMEKVFADIVAILGE